MIKQYNGKQAYEIQTANGTALFSYQTLVAISIIDPRALYVTNKHYSKTTTHHINLFLQRLHLQFFPPPTYTTPEHLQSMLTVQLTDQPAPDQEPEE